MEILEQVLKCSTRRCGCEGIPYAMSLPSTKEMQAASGGKRVRVANFPKFAICWRCASTRRKAGKNVQRYESAVSNEGRRNRALNAEVNVGE